MPCSTVKGCSRIYLFTSNFSNKVPHYVASCCSIPVTCCCLLLPDRQPSALADHHVAITFSMALMASSIAAAAAHHAQAWLASFCPHMNRCRSCLCNQEYAHKVSYAPCAHRGCDQDILLMLLRRLKDEVILYCSRWRIMAVCVSVMSIVFTPPNCDVSFA